VLFALPTFGDEISPRFCFAQEVLLVEVQGHREASRARLGLPEGGYPSRLRALQSAGVTVLVCGGFQAAFLGEAEHLGIHVVWGASGPLAACVADLLAGRLAAPGRHPHCWCQTPSRHTSA